MRHAVDFFFAVDFSLISPNFFCFHFDSVWLLRRLINAIYRFFIGRVRRQRDELKETGKRELVEHLKAIDFAKTQRLLVQYKARFSDKPQQPSTPTQRKQPATAPKTAPPKPSAAATTSVSTAAVEAPRTPQPDARPQAQPQPPQTQPAPRYVPQEPPRSPYMPPVPRPVSADPRVQQYQQRVPQNAAQPAPPASFMDRTVAWLVGEGAEQEVDKPLLCRRCHAPQRLMPQGEIVEFVCAKCGFLNSEHGDNGDSAHENIDSSTNDDTATTDNDEHDKNDDNERDEAGSGTDDTEVAAKED